MRAHTHKQRCTTERERVGGGGREGERKRGTDCRLICTAPLCSLNPNTNKHTGDCSDEEIDETLSQSDAEDTAE